MSIRLLRDISIGYLLLPNVLFYYYWTRPIIAVVGISLLLYLFIRQLSDGIFHSEKAIFLRDWIYIGVAALFLTLFSGITGICHQHYDFWGHNTKFYVLFAKDWPLRYPETGPAYSYYFGYYLVPTLLSKTIGSLSEVCIFFWTYLGFGLGIAWLYIVLNKRMGYVLLCLCIGGTSSMVWLIAHKLGLEFYTYGDVEIEMWSLINSTLLMLNQVIPTLIIGAMLVYLLQKGENLENIIFPITLIFWWAVFPALTFSLLGAILIVRKWLLQRFKLDWSVLTEQIILPGVACLPVLLLFQSHAETPISGLVWKFGFSTWNVLAKYLMNIGTNSVIFILAYGFLKKESTNLPDFPFYLIIVLVLILPLYRVGVHNDMLHRGLMPYTLIIGLYLLIPLSYEKSYSVVSEIAKKSLLNFIVMYFLLTSTYVPLLRLQKALKENVVTAKLFPNRIKFKPYPYDNFKSIYEMLMKKYTPLGARQYLGQKDSIYERYIGRQQ